MMILFQIWHVMMHPFSKLYLRIPLTTVDLLSMHTFGSKCGDDDDYEGVVLSHGSNVYSGNPVQYTPLIDSFKDNINNSGIFACISGNTNCDCLSASTNPQGIFTNDSDYEGLWFSIESSTDIPSTNSVYTNLFSAIENTFPTIDEEETCSGCTDIDGDGNCDDMAILIGSNLPAEFSISQNFPNPFNPVTNIIYALPENVNVQIVVFNLSGKQVATLVNQFQTPGYHSVIWNANNHPSGLYFINMTSGSYVEIMKLMLVK